MTLEDQQPTPWFNEAIEEQLVSGLRTAYYEDSGRFLQGIVRKLYLEDKPAAEAMYKELSYWVDHDKKRL
jgi:hypothetical protein